MNTTLITQTCSSVNRKHTVPPPEGANLHGTRFNGEQISRAGRIEKGITHKPCKGGLSVPAIKTDKVLNNGETKMDEKMYKVEIIVTKEPPNINDFATVEELNEMRMESVKKKLFELLGNENGNQG